MDVWNGATRLAARIRRQADAGAGASKSILYNIWRRRACDTALVSGRQRQFMETWMAGGTARAGYDEMVFRSMVRDDARAIRYWLGLSIFVDFKSV
jgi:hypothetical protein